MKKEQTYKYGETVSGIYYISVYVVLGVWKLDLWMLLTALVAASVFYSALCVVFMFFRLHPLFYKNPMQKFFVGLVFVPIIIFSLRFVYPLDYQNITMFVVLIIIAGLNHAVLHTAFHQLIHKK